MNIQIAPELTVLDSPATQTVQPTGPATDSSPLTTNQKPSTNRLHRKIAKLPKPLRDLINSMLDDGASGPEIIARLQASTDPPLPYPISEMDISRWRATGYARYLAQQDRMASLQADREAALEIVSGDDTTTLPEATLQIIAGQYFQFLGDFSLGSLKQKLAEDPLRYTRFLNVFARLVREIVHLQKHRQDCARAAAAQLKELDPDRDLVSEELRLLVDKMDRTFRVARPELARRSLSASPPPQPVPPPPSPQTPQPASPSHSLTGSLIAPKSDEGGPIYPTPDTRHPIPDTPSPSPAAPLPSRIENPESEPHPPTYSLTDSPAHSLPAPPPAPCLVADQDAPSPVLSPKKAWLPALDCG